MTAKFFPATTGRSGGVRSLPLFRSPGSVFGPSTPAAPPPVEPAQPSLPFVLSQDRTELYGSTPATPPAERALWDAVQRAANTQHGVRREWVAARRAIGLANRTGTPASKWQRAVVFAPAYVKRRRSLAFAAFNRATAALRAADQAVATATADLAALLAPGAAS